MYRVLNGITPPKDEVTLWRYMNFEKFANILATKSLFFTRADKFDDRFEGFTPPLVRSVYEDAVNRVENKDLKIPSKSQGAILKFLENWRKYVMCSCWYQGEETLPMWERYQVRDSGIAIKTTVRDFKNCLRDKLNVFIGKIQYIDYPNYMPQNLSDLSMIYSWYFLKRKAFVHEREFRAIIDAHSFVKDYFDNQGGSVSLQTIKSSEFPDLDGCEYGKYLNIDVNMLIREVIISPYADKWIMETVKSMVKQYEFNFPVRKSELLESPV